MVVLVYSRIDSHPVRSCGRKRIPSRIDAGRRLGSVVRGSDGPDPSVIAEAAKSRCLLDARLRPPVEEASPFSSTSLLQLAAVEQRLPRAMNEVWNLGPQTTPSEGPKPPLGCQVLVRSRQP